MIDPVLERNLADCTEILDLWRKFHDYLASGAKGESISETKEADFLGVKSRIAMLHDSFMAALQADRNIGQSMLTIVGRAITLHHLARMSVAEIKKMEIEWHQAYLLLQETLGNLEEKRAKLADVSEASYRAEMMKTRVKQRFDKIFKSNMFIGLCIFGGILFATVGVQVTGIFDWASLRNFGLTKSVFYQAYDNGLRRVPFLATMPYYRLDWVDIPFKDDERDKIPGQMWRYHPETEANAPSEAKVNVRQAIVPTLGLPDATIQALNNASDYEELWFSNSSDFICMAMFLMDSKRQAQSIAEDIRNTVSGTSAREVGAINRANILIVVYLSEQEGSQQSRDAFSEFVQRGDEIIW